jgi:hypothetical protein
LKILTSPDYSPVRSSNPPRSKETARRKEPNNKIHSTQSTESTVHREVSNGDIREKQNQRSHHSAGRVGHVGHSIGQPIGHSAKVLKAKGASGASGRRAVGPSFMPSYDKSQTYLVMLSSRCHHVVIMLSSCCHGLCRNSCR